MTLFERGTQVYRWLLRLPGPRITPGHFLVVACADSAADRVSAIRTLERLGRAVVVGGPRRTYPVPGTVRWSLLAACQTGRIPVGMRGARLSRVVNELELKPVLEERLETLSGLSQLTAGVGIGLLLAPNLLIVDEPSGLPEPDRTRMVALFRHLQMRMKVTTVWLTANPLDIAGLTDRALDWGQAKAMFGAEAAHN